MIKFDFDKEKYNKIKELLNNKNIETYEYLKSYGLNPPFVFNSIDNHGNIHKIISDVLPTFPEFNELINRSYK